MDVDGTGSIEKGEFAAVMKVPRLNRLCRVLDIDTTELEGMFDLIDQNSDGVLVLEEFRDVFFALMRPPQSKHLVAAAIRTTHCKRMLEEVKEVLQSRRPGGDPRPLEVKVA